jgi:tetratricopeptide (TPR) repeat protein
VQVDLPVRSDILITDAKTHHLLLCIAQRADVWKWRSVTPCITPGISPIHLLPDNQTSIQLFQIVVPPHPASHNDKEVAMADKTRFRTVNHNRLLAGCVIGLLVVMVTGTYVSAEVDEGVRNAYELRMSGKVDEAKSALNEIIANDPDNAAAHYELARTEMHIATGNPAGLTDAVAAAKQHVVTAVEKDPENVMYCFFRGRVAFLDAYIAMSRDDAATGAKVKELVEAYESSLKLKPDCHEAALYLVEIYKTVPEEKGGNPALAEQYTAKLEATDPVWGAKARALMMPEGTDMVAYWKKLLDDDPDNPELLFELGRAHLINNEGELGVACYEKAMKVDPDRTMLSLEIGRYYVLQTMGNPATADQNLPRAANAIQVYLDSEPARPYKAYAKGMLAKIRMGQNDKAGMDKAAAEAQALDPYYSRAFGVPAADLYVALGDTPSHHRYLFVPY